MEVLILLFSLVFAGIVWRFTVKKYALAGKSKWLSHLSGFGFGLLTFMISLVTLILITGKPDEASETASDTEVAASAARPSDTPLPEYKIIKNDKLQSIKRSVEVLLEQKATESELSKIANQIRSSSGTEFDRTFIGYYLPNQDRENGYWATSHFNPTLSVSILGLSIEQQSKLESSNEPLNGELIGTWLDARPGLGYKITFIRRTSGIYMRSTFPDGSSSEDAIVEIKTDTETRYQELGNEFEEFFILAQNGNLEFWSKNEKYYTAMPFQ